MARPKKSDTEAVAEKAGRALVDLPDFDLKSGEFGTVPECIADQLETFGMFDTKAKE